MGGGQRGDEVERREEEGRDEVEVNKEEGREAGRRVERKRRGESEGRRQRGRRRGEGEQKGRQQKASTIKVCRKNEYAHKLS